MANKANKANACDRTAEILKQTNCVHNDGWYKQMCMFFFKTNIHTLSCHSSSYYIPVHIPLSPVSWFNFCSKNCLSFPSWLDAKHNVQDIIRVWSLHVINIIPRNETGTCNTCVRSLWQFELTFLTSTIWSRSKSRCSRFASDAAW